MKTETDVYRAHDLLVAILLNEVPVSTDPAVKRLMSAALDALCWVLDHDDGKHGCNTEFGDNMKRIEAKLATKGFVLHRKNN